MSAYPTIARNTYWSALSTFSGLLLGLVTNVFLARTLGASALGSYNYWLWLIGLLALVASPGLPHAMTKFASEYMGQKKRDTASAIFARLLLAELILGASVGITLLIYAWATPSQDSTALTLVFFSVALFALEGFVIGAAKGALDFRIFSQASLVGGVVYAIAAATVVSLGFGIYELLLVFIARRVVTIMLIGWKLPIHYTLRGALRFRIPPKLRQRVVRYCRDIVLIFVTSTIPFERSGVYFLNRFATDADIAYYSQSFDLALKAMAIPAIFTATLLPTFSLLQGQNNREEIKNVYLSSNRIAASIAMPIGLGGAAIASSVSLLYGSEFIAMSPILAIFFVGSIVSAVASVSVSILYSEEGQQFIVRLNAVIALLSISLALLLIPNYGAIGAAVATSASKAISGAVCMAYTARRLQLSLPYRVLSRICLAALSTAAVAWFISVSIGGIVIAVAAAALAYPVMLRLFAALDASDRILLGQLGQNLPKKLTPAYAKFVQLLVPKDL